MFEDVFFFAGLLDSPPFVLFFDWSIFAVMDRRVETFQIATISKAEGVSTMLLQKVRVARVLSEGISMDFKITLTVLSFMQRV